MSVQAIKESEFETGIRNNGLTLVEFGAAWCPPCKVLLPILHQLSDSYGEKLSILTVDCDESPAAAATYGVMSMPTVILFHNGEPVEKLVGLRSKTVYESLLTRYLQ